MQAHAVKISLSTYADVLALVEDGAAEGLRLEFKEKEEPSSPKLSRTDKRNIAQAVSSFANSDGGLLIYGVRTERRDGADVAAQLMPIADISAFLNNFRAVVSLNISPELQAIDVGAVPSVELLGGGFVVCNVGRSDARPHMSIAPGVHSYFRRSFDGNVPMTPSEVKDQVLAMRDAILEPQYVWSKGGVYSTQPGWIAAQIPIEFRLKNVGRALCRNPFLRVRPSCTLHAQSGTFDASLASWKTTFPYGTLIHVNDQERCFELRVNALIYLDVLGDLFAREEIDLTDAVIMLPGQADYRCDTITDKVSLEHVGLSLSYGAENAPATEKEVLLTRRSLAQRLLVTEEVKTKVLDQLSPLRSDLIAKFAVS